jgi:hypothetical protein
VSRDVVLAVRVTEKEAEFLRWRARAAGTNVSEQIRQALTQVKPYVVVAVPA